MKFLNVKTQSKIISVGYKYLKELNGAFVRGFVNRMIRTPHDEILYKVKEEGRVYEEEIAYMLQLLENTREFIAEIEDEIATVLLLEASDPKFPRKINEENLKKLVKSSKSLNSLIQEIDSKFASYKKFVLKQAKLADHLYKQEMKKKYENEMKSKNQTPKENISENFKGLDDKILLQYFKQYQRLLNKYEVLFTQSEKTDLPSQEQQIKVFMDDTKAHFLLIIAAKELRNLEEYYYKVSPEVFKQASQSFKKIVVEFSKRVNIFDRTLNSFEKSR